MTKKECRLSPDHLKVLNDALWLGREGYYDPNRDPRPSNEKRLRIIQDLTKQNPSNPCIKEFLNIATDLANFEDESWTSESYVPQTSKEIEDDLDRAISGEFHVSEVIRNISRNKLRDRQSELEEDLGLVEWIRKRNE